MKQPLPGTGILFTKQDWNIKQLQNRGTTCNAVGKAPEITLPILCKGQSAFVVFAYQVRYTIKHSLLQQDFSSCQPQ